MKTRIEKIRIMKTINIIKTIKTLKKANIKNAEGLKEATLQENGANIVLYAKGLNYKNNWIKELETELKGRTNE